MSSLTKTINNVIVELFVGDYINTHYDAMVIPSNSRLLPSGKLRCYVLRNAGSSVQIECNRIINKLCTIPVGQAIMTSGGNLKTNYIIHIITPKINLPKPAKKLMMATWNCLKLANKMGLTSILFPPFSSDLLGFDADLCAKTLIPTIHKFLTENNQNLKNVSICLEDLSEYNAFETVLKDL